MPDRDSEFKYKLAKGLSAMDNSKQGNTKSDSTKHSKELVVHKTKRCASVESTAWNKQSFSKVMKYTYNYYLYCALVKDIVEHA